MAPMPQLLEHWLLEASHHVRSAITLRPPSPKKPNKKERASAKDHQGSRYTSDDVILKVNPPAGGAPADAM